MGQPTAGVARLLEVQEKADRHPPGNLCISRGRPAAARADHRGSGFQQAGRYPGGRRLRRGPPDIVDFISGEAREGTCGGRGAKLKCWVICLQEWRWIIGTSGRWGSEG